jgi:AAA lid domain
MITGADGWHALPGQGQHVLRCLYQAMTHERKRSRSDELVIILAGQAGPLRDMLAAAPALAARFPAVIDFPGYTPGQLGGVFSALAGEAGFAPTSEALAKAAAVLARAEAGLVSGNARLAVQLLNHAATAQARRITAALSPRIRPCCRLSAPPTSPVTLTRLLRPHLANGRASICNPRTGSNGPGE